MALPESESFTLTAVTFAVAPVILPVTLDDNKKIPDALVKLTVVVLDATNVPVAPVPESVTVSSTWKLAVGASIVILVFA